MADAGTAPVTKRDFLSRLIGTTAAAWLASVLYPVLRYLKPTVSAGPAGPVALTRPDMTKLESQRFVIVPLGQARVIVFEDEERRLRALDAKCTHEGCTVRYVRDRSIIWCACHDGRFDLDGNVVSGPPPRPLDRYTVQRQDDGVVLLHPKKEA